MTEETKKMIEWNGGECPVDPNAYVYIRYRGYDEEGGPYLARPFDWKHIGDGSDIIAYRLAD